MTQEKKNRLKTYLYILLAIIAVTGIIIIVVHYIQVANASSLRAFLPFLS